MAMIDYGAIVMKNGQQINHELFEDMEESVGWSDRGREYVDQNNNAASPSAYLSGNYYAYVGDADCTLAFYKGVVRFSSAANNAYLYECLSYGKGVGKSRHVKYFGTDVHIKEITDGVYMASLSYKGDCYRVIYGYGIDPDMSVWDKVKVKYLGRRGAKKVDYALGRYKNKNRRVTNV